MQDFIEPEKLLGLQADTPEIQELLANLGAKPIVRISKGENDVYVNCEDLGVSLLFESERYIASTYGIQLPSEAPALTSIQLYGKEADGFSIYAGKLWRAVKFTDGREVLIGKLGESSRFSERLKGETWNISKAADFIVSYSDDLSSVIGLQYSTDFGTNE